MSLQTKGADILKEHNELYFELITIPELREMSFRMEDVNGNQIGYPVFKEAVYSWPTDLLTRFKTHLQNMWNFFKEYSFWFDDALKPIITYDDNRIDKQSVIFLLQDDVFQTDVVYGAYLIEKEYANYSISYFRRNQKIKTFKPNISTEVLEKWICNDARKQIIDQFSFLWNYLQSEMETCIKEEYNKLPAELLTHEYILDQNKKISTVIDQFPEYALLNLGRIAELYLIQLLKWESGKSGINLSWEAENNGLINKSQMELFESIRKECNILKHRLDYSFNGKKIKQLWKDFSTIITSQD